MRKCYTLLAAAMLLAVNAYADHISGGELRYEYAGGTSYRIELSIYTQCTGTALPGSISVSAASAACGLSLTPTLNYYKTDTLQNIFCSTAAGICTGTPYYMVHRYSNTVSLSACSDWKISYSNCCRSLAIQNITMGTGMYLEAFLNNSSAPNSSAFIDNPPPFVTAFGAVVSTPIHTTDVEGDSFAHSMITPLVSAGTSATYNTGFSATNPLGTGIPAVISAAPEVLKTSSNAGRFALAMRTYDYRNGVLVGYSSRDWEQRAASTANPKNPLPTSSTGFNASICPGGTTTINLGFRDSTGTDSVYAYIAGQPGVPGFTSSIVSAPGIGTGNVQYTLTAPATLNAAANPYFIIPVFVRDNACPIRGYAIYNIVLRVAPCVPDTVWAGDANGDKTVNMYDPLAISLAYNRTGPTRAGASIAWAPQPCGNWASSFLSGVNMKHADCNGDGTVNNSDLAAVTANYALTHPKEFYQSHAKVAGIPDLYFDHTGMAVYPGATVSIPVRLGSSTSLFNNLYGIAASLRISGITPTIPASPLSYASSWLGNSSNTLQFAKVTTTNNVDWAYARNNRLAVSGNGTLANFSFTVPPGATPGQKIILTFNNVLIINAAGTELNSYNILSDTLTVRPAGIGTGHSMLREAVVVPNPSNGPAMLTWTLQTSSGLGISISDMTGRVVWRQRIQAAAGNGMTSLPAEELPSGIYMIRIRTEDDANSLGIKWMKSR